MAKHIIWPHTWHVPERPCTVWLGFFWAFLRMLQPGKHFGNKSKILALNIESKKILSKYCEYHSYILKIAKILKNWLSLHNSINQKKSTLGQMTYTNINIVKVTGKIRPKNLMVHLTCSSHKASCTQVIMDYQSKTGNWMPKFQLV